MLRDGATRLLSKTVCVVRQGHRSHGVPRAFVVSSLAIELERMPSFRHRLSRAQQVQYDRSNAVSAVPLRPTPRLLRAIELLPEALLLNDRTRTERIAQAICDELCGILRVPALRVQVGEVRPSDHRGELHGLYVPAAGGRQDRISVWMKTAKRGQVVAFRTFLRTLLHEVCHHLDYELIRLRVSLHTDGFFKRESSLFNQLVRREPSNR
jgi:hypothetical protein